MWFETNPPGGAKYELLMVFPRDDFRRLKIVSLMSRGLECRMSLSGVRHYPSVVRHS